MKKVVIIVGLVLLLALSYLYLTRAPLRSGYLGPVSVSVQQLKTNALGQVTATVTVTNAGSHMIRCAVGTQVLRGSEWVDALSGTSNSLNLAIDADSLISPK